MKTYETGCAVLRTSERQTPRMKLNSNSSFSSSLFLFPASIFYDVNALSRFARSGFPVRPEARRRGGSSDFVIPANHNAGAPSTLSHIKRLSWLPEFSGCCDLDNVQVVTSTSLLCYEGIFVFPTIASEESLCTRTSPSFSQRELPTARQRFSEQNGVRH